ncbi:hypothetical protein EW146_g7219 [Bondarzewia mesenterica]|uniref:DUF5648 domain-containing protein n=1 Tax=Bondarzewia mesenterica TaxID=1095465 RepID=A0A4S4LLF8_9AGAM|nr:hypothetical protein EW146_g7219 [Bondarzewia mesenterica]
MSAELKRCRVTEIRNGSNSTDMIAIATFDSKRNLLLKLGPLASKLYSRTYIKTFLSLSAILLSLNQVSALVAQSREVMDQDAEVQNTYCDYSSSAIPLYRGYTPSGTDHFYTTNAAEMENAVDKLGFTSEGDAAYVFGSHSSYTSTIPLYRMYSSSAVDHFYTTSASERDNAVNNLGYSDEGIAAFVYSSNICGSIPLYRVYSPGATDHFYTTSASERDNAVVNLGYNDEGVAAYVLPVPS